MIDARTRFVSGLVCREGAEVSPIRKSKLAILAHPSATLESATMFMGIYTRAKMNPTLFYALNRTSRPKLVQLARPL